MHEGTRQGAGAPARTGRSEGKAPPRERHAVRRSLTREVEGVPTATVEIRGAAGAALGRTAEVTGRVPDPDIPHRHRQERHAAVATSRSQPSAVSWKPTRVRYARDSTAPWPPITSRRNPCAANTPLSRYTNSPGVKSRYRGVT